MKNVSSNLQFSWTNRSLIRKPPIHQKPQSNKRFPSGDRGVWSSAANLSAVFLTGQRRPPPAKTKGPLTSAVRRSFFRRPDLLFLIESRLSVVSFAIKAKDARRPGHRLRRQTPPKDRGGMDNWLSKRKRVEIYAGEKAFNGLVKHWSSEVWAGNEGATDFVGQFWGGRLVCVKCSIDESDTLQIFCGAYVM